MGVRNTQLQAKNIILAYEERIRSRASIREVVGELENRIIRIKQSPVTLHTNQLGVELTHYLKGLRGKYKEKLIERQTRNR